MFPNCCQIGISRPHDFTETLLLLALPAQIERATCGLGILSHRVTANIDDLERVEAMCGKMRSMRQGRVRVIVIAVTAVFSGCTINVGSTGTDLSSEQDASQLASEAVDATETTVSVSNDAGSSVDNKAEQTGTASGQRYLQIVNEVNCLVESILALERKNSLGDGSYNPAILPDAQILFAKLANAREVAVRNLLDENWPQGVGAEIDLIARDWSEIARTEVLLAEAPDLGAYNQLIAVLQAFVREGNPGYVRSQLGVGPATETNNC